MVWKSIIYLAAAALVSTACHSGNVRLTESPTVSAVKSPEPLVSTTSTPVLSDAPVFQVPSTLTPSQSVIGDTFLDAMNQIELDRAIHDLKKMTGEEPLCLDGSCHTIQSRETGSEGLGWVKEYIYRELVALGYAVEYDDWSQGEFSDQNIIAGKPGTVYPGEKIYFVAHIDGIHPNLLSARPAADDNASGVVGLLEMARILRNYDLERTIILFFSTGEEQGTLGVRNYLDHLSAEQLDAIKYVVDVDVIGYDANKDHLMELWHGDDPSSFELVVHMSDVIRDHQINLTPVFVVGCG